MAKQKSLELSEPVLVDTFGLERNFKPIPLLNELLNATGELSKADSALLFECQAELIENVDSWNEEELKMQFISFVIFLARFKKPIRTYYDREISAVINDIMVTSKVDMMLSKGIGELIKTPYFFLHELNAARYKREKKYAGDPVGQMLGGMLIGQAKNTDNKPIYGCYVQGRFWFFSVLDGKQYTVSKGFDSSELEDVQKIIFILKKVNLIIQERLLV